MSATSLTAARIARELSEAIAKHAIGDDHLFYRIERECLTAIETAPSSQRVVLLVAAFMAEAIARMHDGRGGFPADQLSYWIEGAEILVAVLQVVDHTDAAQILDRLGRDIAHLQDWRAREP
ncbi:MAG: hypothetical protein ACT4OF_02865 [Caulobacteraceae bacterium]